MFNRIQMVKMRPFAGIYALFIFLCLVYPCIGNTDSQTVVVFKGGATEVSQSESGGGTKKQTPRAFGVPAFVSGVVNSKEFLAVICDAIYAPSEDSILTGPVIKTNFGGHTEWSDAQDLVTTPLNNRKNAVWGNITAVMNGDKIYAIATRYDKSGTSASGKESSITGWDTVMFVGTVAQTTNSGVESVSINWAAGNSLKNLLTIHPHMDPNTRFVGGVGNGVVMKSGAIVLPVQITNTPHDNTTSIIYSTDNGSTWKMGENTFFGVSEGSLVEFGNGKLLFSVRFDRGTREVYESVNMGATWRASNLFMGVWGNQQSRDGAGSQGSVIAVPVNGEDVLLFSHPLNTDKKFTRDTLQLWVSDGKRIICVGKINENEKGVHTGNSVLTYVGNNLYITHEINPSVNVDKTVDARGEWDNVIALSPLPQLFESATNIVRGWRDLDKKYQSKGIPTNGLVGFLGNTKDSAVWTDMYNCVNATVEGGKSVSGGFLFNGAAGGGAKWPVASQGQNQVYMFTRQEFTLAATVTIHSAGGDEGVFLLGASNGKENGDMFGLGYTKEKKWYTLNSDASKHVTTSLFQLGKEYHVALTFRYGVAFVYVDGLKITDGVQIGHYPAWIDHFDICRTGTALTTEGKLCTVKNVMLFKRSLEQGEITHLSNANKRGNLDEPMQTEDAARVSQNIKTISTTKPQSVPGKVKTMSTIEPKSGPENPKIVSVTEPQEISVTDKQSVIDKHGKGKSVDHIAREHRNGNFEKHIKRVDGAALSIAFVPFLCFFCSIILIAGV